MSYNLRTTPACGRATDVVLSTLFGIAFVALTIGTALAAFALFHAGFGMSKKHAAAATLVTWMLVMLCATGTAAYLIHRARDDNDEEKLALLDDQ